MHGLNETQKLELYVKLAEQIGQLSVPIVMNANLEPEDFPQVLAAACAIALVQLFRSDKCQGEATAVYCMNTIHKTCKRNGIPIGVDHRNNGAPLVVN